LKCVFVLAFTTALVCLFFHLFQCIAALRIIDADQGKSSGGAYSDDDNDGFSDAPEQTGGVSIVDMRSGMAGDEAAGASEQDMDDVAMIARIRQLRGDDSGWQRNLPADTDTDTDIKQSSSEVSQSTDDKQVRSSTASGNSKPELTHHRQRARLDSSSDSDSNSDSDDDHDLSPVRRRGQRVGGSSDEDSDQNQVRRRQAINAAGSNSDSDSDSDSNSNSNGHSDTNPVRRRQSRSSTTCAEAGQDNVSDSDGDLAPIRRGTVRKRTQTIDNADSNKRARLDEDATPTNTSRATGLVTGAQFAERTQAQIDAERALLTNVDPALSGAHAKTVIRDKDGRRVESVDELHKGVSKEEEDAPLPWASGIAQVRQAREAQKEFASIAAAPMRRGVDDAELNDMMRSRSRWGDPMAALRNRKETSSSNIDDRKSNKRQERPVYKGSAWPNRFNILPGYRWDGVDRSNGWEKRLFLRKNEQSAKEEARYKWSTEDM
jgi:pre-mRNA-splicing factor CWC26